MLQENKTKTRKERLTKTRMFTLMQNEEYTGSYSAFTEFTRQLEQELFLDHEEAFIKLLSTESTMQVDFGEMNTIYRGKKTKVIAFCAKLKYSKCEFIADISKCYDRILGLAQEKHWSYEQFFDTLLDEELISRENNRFSRLCKKANFPVIKTFDDFSFLEAPFIPKNACIEDIEYHTDCKFDKAQITRLSTCNYIAEHHNIILLGASGAGKTYIGCAFGIAACRNFYTTKYVRLPELLDELAVARGQGIYQKVMKTYKKVSLLIIDEWLLVPLTNTESRDLLEIIESRYKTASTIFCSQFTTGGWHEKIGEGTLADAILDRIIHDSYTIFIDGQDSMRKRKGIQE